MFDITPLFPTLIYSEFDLLSKEDNQQLIDYCFSLYDQNYRVGSKKWVGNTFTTHGNQDIFSDPKLAPLIQIIKDRVHVFAKAHDSYGEYECKSAWVNIAYAGDWQESHYHKGSIFSAVYYPRFPKDSGVIEFEDPRPPEMYPLKDIRTKNPSNFQKIIPNIEERQLLIFRSWLRHMVHPGTNTDPRFSIAMNFS